MDKIQPLEHLPELLASLRLQGKRIVHCHGIFDLLHPGHLFYFESAKKEGDVLVVTLTSDRHVNLGPDRPAFTQDLRAKSLSMIACVDFVAVNDHPSSVPAIETIRPDVYVKGADSEGFQEEEAALGANGGRMHFTDDPVFSSSKLINQYLTTAPVGTRIFLQEFQKKHSHDDVIAAIDSVGKMRALVIGEAIIDEYRYVRSMGKSAKENLVAFRYDDSELFAGGVVACANHAAGFVEKVDMLTVLGRKDPQDEFIVSKLKSNVVPRFFYREDAPTVRKTRYVDPFMNKLFSVYHFNDEPLPNELDAELRVWLEQHLAEYDFVIALDYGHGMLSAATIELLSRKSRFLAVNTQTNAANTGFNPITKYPHADFICIDEPEIRIAAGDRVSPVEVLLPQIAARVGARRAIVTRGHKGSLALDETGALHSICVLSNKVVDRVGAGDAFLSLAAPCAASGLPMDLVGFIGNAAGALAVGIVGNRSSVEPTALKKFIKTLMA
jgi:cytidyltransferase-like protein